MQILVHTGQISDFEALRQQLEAVLGSSGWYINGNANSVELVNSTEIELTQENLDSIVLFHNEVGSEWSSAFYNWDPETRKFVENVASFREFAKARIDILAGEVRSKYLTIAPGQEATYVSKEAECRQFKADGYPEDLGPYLWVQAEMDATGFTAQEAADAVIFQADQWKVLGSMIERTRLKGKSDLDKRNKISTAKASFEATVAALQAL